MIKNTISNILQVIDLAVKQSSVNTKMIGNESINIEDPMVGETVKDVDQYIKSNLVSLAASNENSLNPIDNTKLDIISKVIKNTMLHAANPNSMSNHVTQIMSNPIPNNKNIKVVSTESVNFANTFLSNNELRDFVNLNVGNEAWDGQFIGQSLAYNIVVNFSVSEQDEFNKAFFPLIAIEPTDSFFLVEANTTHVMNSEYIYHDINGGPSKRKFDRVSGIKSMLMPGVWSSNRNRLVPVMRTENEDVNFLKDLKRTSKDTGYEVTTAPLKIDVEHNLLGISHDDALAARGNPNHTDAVDRDITLENIYVMLSNDTKSSIIKFKVKFFRASRFVMSQQGDYEKLMNLSFSSDSMYIDVSKSRDVKGNELEVLEDIKNDLDGYKLRLSISASGSINTEIGDVTISNVGTGGIFEIYDANGKLLPLDDGKYTTVKDNIKKVTIVGYDLIAYRTNSNLRVNGKVLKSDVSKTLYTVPWHTSVTIGGPVTNAFGTDNDINRLESAISIGNVIIRQNGVSQILDFCDTLRHISEAAIGDIKPAIDSISEHYIDMYYKHVDIDLTSMVDSIKSSDRLKDLQSALINKITQDALEMGVASKYFNAFNAFFPSESSKIYVIVGTDNIFGTYLSSGYDDGEIPIKSNMVLKVVSTDDPRFQGKVVSTFTIYDSNRHKSPTPLSFGWMPWAPATVVDINRTIDGATEKTLMSFLRFANITNLPIVTEYDIAGIQSVLGKVILYTKEIKASGRGI